MATPFGGGRVGGSGPRLEVVGTPGIVGNGGNVPRGGGTGREDLGGTDGGGSTPAWRSGGGGLDVRAAAGAIDGNGQSVGASETKGFCAGLTLAGGGGGGANENGEGPSDGGLGGSVFCFGGGACAGGGRGENPGEDPALGGNAGRPSDPRRDRGGGGGKGGSVPRRGGSGGACDGRAALTGPRPSKTSRFDSSLSLTVGMTPASCSSDELGLLVRSAPVSFFERRCSAHLEGASEANSTRWARAPLASW
jgi:hypothetical protein